MLGTQSRQLPILGKSAYQKTVEKVVLSGSDESMEAKQGEGQGEHSTGCCFSGSAAQMSLPQEASKTCECKGSEPCRYLGEEA